LVELLRSLLAHVQIRGDVADAEKPGHKMSLRPKWQRPTTRPHFSGGACLVAAERLLRDRHVGQTIAIVVADSGMKYLSTDLWDTEGYGSR
jgi:hypothetical protein